jgi:hypothetical protein
MIKNAYHLNDQRLVLAKLDYVSEVEDTLELNYKVLNMIVLLCNWVKANCYGSSAAIKCDEYGFVFVIFFFLYSHFKPIICFTTASRTHFFPKDMKERARK